MDAVTIILVLVLLIAAFLIGHWIGVFRRDRYWESELPEHRREAIAKSRAVLGGQFSEQLAPFLPDFKYLPTECRFIGKPIDLLVFRGMDQKEIDEVVFVEVKSGKARNSPVEKSLKDTIEKKRVRWEEYRIPEDLTKEHKDKDVF
jgi:predicted Holliday junction resolvase-like endonuclease